MTKVTFIGQEPTKESKHIELVRQYLGTTCINATADVWDNCQLVKHNALDGLDLIYCYHNPESGQLYFGRWNDGTTERGSTVCTVLGEDVAVKKGKGIEFVKCLNSYCQPTNTNAKPNDFKNVEIICTSYSATAGDLFFAYNDSRSEGVLYLGHLNDGFVE